MRPLLEHLPEVAERISHAQQVLLGLDYDGTLTPLVDNPTSAMLTPIVRDLIQRLAHRAGWTVAIVSGRGLHDLRQRVGLDEVFYAGNHGLEISGPATSFVEPRAWTRRSDLAVLSHRLKHKLAAIPGVIVELKGLTTSIHFRQVADSARNGLHQITRECLIDTRSHFRLTLGNHVLEIRPNVEWDKGTAVLWIQNQMAVGDRVSIYAGDDTTDEDVFMALPNEIMIKVGQSRQSHGNFWINDPCDVIQFLQWLAALE